MRLDLSNRSGHKLAGRQVTESTLIRQRAMAQQLCEYAQRLIGEILVDEGFLPGQRLRAILPHFDPCPTPFRKRVHDNAQVSPLLFWLDTFPEFSERT
jgi:hypothetical protein